jgi:hypothetical protein
MNWYVSPAVWYWHWHWLNLLVTVYNAGHGSLVLCPLLNIFTFSTFILKYTTTTLIFATPPPPQFMIYSSSYFITDLFHFSLHLLKYIPTFCSLSLSLIVTILLIQISVWIFVNRLSTSSSLQLLVSSHLSMWLQPSSLLHIGHIRCSVHPSISRRPF